VLRIRIAALIAVFTPALGLQAQTPAFVTHPDIHGNRLVFTAEGDLWMADAQSGEAWRITSDPGVESSAHFSPDGSQIAFVAGYDGGDDVYVMPTAGGIPKRLTYDATDPDFVEPAVLGWTPDGTRVIFGSGAKLYGPHFEQEMTHQLFTVPAVGGMPKLLPVPRGAFASLNPDGHTLAYVPTSSFWLNWFRYQGGEADRIWLADLNSPHFTQLTNSKSVDTEPIWVGQQLYFVSERSGIRNLWRLDVKTKQATQVTFSTDDQVRSPSTDGKRIVFQLGEKLAIYDPASGKTRVVPIQLHSDRIHARPFEAKAWPDDQPGYDPIAATLAPKADRVAIAPRGHLLTAAVEHGAAHTLLDDSGQRVQNPAWSPDGKQIAYISDASGEEQLYLMGDEAGATPRQLTRTLTGEHGTPVWSPDGKRLLIGDRTSDIQLVDVATGTVTTIGKDKGPWSSAYIETDFCFSPDGKWIAYSASLGWRLDTVFLYEIATGRTIRVSDPNIDSSSPVFSRDGKYLFMIQGRVVSQSWLLIDSRMSESFSERVTGVTLNSATALPSETDTKPGGDVQPEGMEGRTFDLGVADGDYSGLWAGDGRVLIQSKSDVLSCEIATGKVTTLAQGVQAIDLSADGKKLLVRGPDALQVIDDTGGTVAAGTGKVDLQGLTITVDPAKEWRQMFDETWRIWRDVFYDPNMHGIDWPAMKRRYEAKLPAVASRRDFTQLVRDMISELNIGHSFAGAMSEFASKVVRPASLGVDLEWDASSGSYKITHIMRGDAWDPDNRSPFAKPGINVREGDHLLKIRGVVLTADQDPAANLLGQAGQEIEVTVAGSSGTRTLTVKPIANDSQLRMKDWMASRREYVEKASGGQLAYVYLSDMGGSGATMYAQQYYSNVLKPGIILDVRGNDGGNISGYVLADLNSHPSAYFAQRNNSNTWREGWAPLGHVALVTNEWAFSDAEYFSECFKRLKIGPLVGHRTTGGLVGPVIYRLIDGGGVGIPNYGAWADGQWLVEGKGAVPDYEVDQDPAAVMAGKDPQLDKAIELLLAELKAHPFQMPQHPPYPIKRGGSQG